MGVVSAVLLVIITILLPPVGVYIVAGCGADLLINICLTLLGYFPGHIHAFYLEYIYYHRREEAREGRFTAARAPGVYSERVQSGGQRYVGAQAVAPLVDVEAQKHVPVADNQAPVPLEPQVQGQTLKA